MGILDRFRQTPEQRAARQADRIEAANVARQRAAELDKWKREQKRNQARDVQRNDVRMTKVLRDEYLTRKEEEQTLQLDPNGLPTAKLVRERNRLVIATSTGWVNPKSTYAYKVGIYSFTIRGTSYYRQAVTTGRFNPGAQVRLEREPDNEHDSHAVAVYAWRARSKAGYINATNAKRIAKRMDAGDDMVAISTRGEGSGRFDYNPQILVAERRIVLHLLSGTGIELAP